MSVGTLNVAVTAPTGEPRGQIDALRGTIRGVGPDAEFATAGLAQLESQLRRAGNTAAEFEAKYRRATVARPPIGGSDVDLRGELGRYDDLEREVGRLTRAKHGLLAASKQLKDAFKVVGAAAKVTAVAVGVFAASVAAGRRIGEYAFGIRSLSKDFQTLKEKAASAWEALADPNLHAAKQRQQAALEERQRKTAEEEQRKRDEAAAKEKERREAFANAQRQVRHDLIAATEGENAAQFADDVQQLGYAEALILYRERNRVADAEAEATERRRKAEERITEQKRLQQKAEAEARRREEKARREREEDLKSVAELEKQARQFWLTDAERRREDALARLEDPRLRFRAERALDDLEAKERRKKQREDDREDRATIRARNPLDVLDARTQEGYAALRANLRGGPQDKILKANEAQVAEQRRTNELLNNMMLSGAGGAGFDPFSEN